MIFLILPVREIRSSTLSDNSLLGCNSLMTR